MADAKEKLAVLSWPELAVMSSQASGTKEVLGKHFLLWELGSG